MALKNSQWKNSTCCYCGVGCGVKIAIDQRGDISVKGNENHPVNQGKLCSKGINLQYTVNDKSDRLLYPQMRYNKKMPLERSSWDEVLERTAAVFKTFIERYGPNSVGFYASGQCLTEEYYVINKLIKGFIGSNNIDTNSRLCMSSAVAAYKMALGEDSVPICYDDIELSDCLLIEGANPAWCHPILWRRVEAHKAQNPECKIIVVDPRKTDTCSIADIHLQLNPGTDIILNHALGRILIEEKWIDQDFIEQHTTGFQDYYDTVMKRSISESAIRCGVPEELIRETAKHIAEATGFLSLWTMGLNQSAIGVDKNLSLINLNLITGKIGKPGSGPFSLTGQPNAMGGREVGGLANLLPAHRDLKNPAHRKELQKFWGGTVLSDQPGLTATEMFEALQTGQLKAIWIVCTNPLTSLPNARQVEEALKAAKFVVVQEISNSAQTLSYADVILPAAAWAEKEGSMTNSERRISYLPKLVDPPGEALADAEIICRFARKMGYTGFDYRNMEDIYLEHVRLTAKTNLDITGLNYSIIQELNTVQWPYHKRKKSGTARLFENHQFYTPNHKAQIHHGDPVLSSEPTNEDYPFILTTGRIRDQWHTMSKTGKVAKLKQHIAKAFLEIHPEDAAQLQIHDGQLVQVSSRRGEVRVKTKLTDSIKPGCVFLPMHWGKYLGSDLNRTNNITSPIVDPISKEPDFKYCAVQISPYQKPFQRIVVIGAGAGAYGFIKAYREQNQIDEITVFSSEDLPFYNRVMLPHYVSGEQSWSELVRIRDDEENEKYKLQHLRGVTVTAINRKEKFVQDERGIRTPYDVLILATGSRASIPKHIPKLTGIFSIRKRSDADSLKKYLQKNAHVVIVGGGLLGLEMAASLQERHIKTSIIQRTSKLLNRQLDDLGSQLLHEEMIDQGCDIYYNDEIQLYYGRDKITKIELKSGRQLKCDAVLLAIGTTPNIELAKEAGLECKRGVIVNNRLQSSDPNIFAIGEIAEFENTLYGISTAAEQQGTIAAQYHNGDVSSFYQGSTFMNIIKIPGFDLCSIGLTECPDDRYEEVVFIDKAKRYYKKCIIHQDRLVGTILIGDKNEFLTFKNLISDKTELSEKRLTLLRSGASKEPVIGKLVCSCSQVGEGNLEKSIYAGCQNLAALCETTGAGMGCGSCKPEVLAILEKHNISQSSKT